MTRAGAIRLVLIVSVVGSLELASRQAWINPIAFIPPSKMAEGAWALLRSGQYTHDILLTLARVSVISWARHNMRGNDHGYARETQETIHCGAGGRP